MEEPRKYILDRFQEHLHTSFEAFCSRHALEPSEAQFVSFMIDQGLIPRTNLQRFTVLREFERINAIQEFPKSQLVAVLADRFFISERTVWGILKHHRHAKSIGN